jgi:hypothetical protein
MHEAETTLSAVMRVMISCVVAVVMVVVLLIAA